MASGESFVDGGPGPCLEPEEMLALASGERPAGPAGHLSGCEQCRRAVEDVAAKVRPRRAVPAASWAAAPPRLQSCAPVSIALAIGMVLGLASVARRQCAPPAAPAAVAQEPAVELETLDPALPSTPAPSDLTAVIRENQASVRTCYDRALDVGRIAGTQRLDLKLRIFENGQVNQLRIITHSRVGSDDLTLCVQRAVRRWIFPTHARGYEVEFPLIFRGL